MRTLILLAAVLSLSACGNVRNTTSWAGGGRVYSAYSVTYDDSEQTLETVATYTSGNPTGATLFLDGGSAVHFDGQPLHSASEGMLNNKKNRYRRRQRVSAGEAFREHTIGFTDATGKLHRIAVSIPSLPTFTLSDSSATVNDSIGLAWALPEALGTNDRLYLKRMPDTSSTVTREDLGGVEAEATMGSLSLSSAQLKGWGAGVHRLQLCRLRVTHPDTATTAGGVLEATSCTAALTFTLSN